MLKLLTLILFLQMSFQLKGQASREDTIGRSELSSYIYQKQGFDQILVNGKQYHNQYIRVLGHPFYKQEKSHLGSIVISGIYFEDIQLNYDIYSQDLVLDYIDESGKFNKIILTRAHIEAFTLDGDSFEKLPLGEHGNQLFQVITYNEIRCYIHWEKQMLPTSNNLKYGDLFNEPKRTYFLKVEGKLQTFSNKQSFVAVCSGIPKKEIRKYLRENSLKFSNASSEQIEDLLRFISDYAKQQ